MTSSRDIAEAFSRHRFTDTYDSLAADVRWVAVGGPTIEGRDAVVQACEEASAAMASLKVDRRRFVTIGGDDVVAVDTVTEYVDPDGNASLVASCDIYEFGTDGSLVAITSYAAELEQ